MVMVDQESLTEWMKRLNIEGLNYLELAERYREMYQYNLKLLAQIETLNQVVAEISAHFRVGLREY